MSDHTSYRFSITIASDDLALVNCLRSLSQFSQKTGNNRISWGGTKDADWKKAGHCVTFRFSSAAYREGLVAELMRLLPQNLWQEVKRSDQDPASPQT